MTAKWHRAVADAGEEEGPDDYEQAVRGELESLWCDLTWAVHDAHRGGWSIGCDNIAFRIVILSRLAGATPWRHIGYPLLLDGTYDGLLTDAGIAHDAPGADDLRKMQEWTDAQRSAARPTDA